MKKETCNHCEIGVMRENYKECPTCSRNMSIIKCTHCGHTKESSS